MNKAGTSGGIGDSAINEWNLVTIVEEVHLFVQQMHNKCIFFVAVIHDRVSIDHLSMTENVHHGC